jgi:hypothetical protein
METLAAIIGGGGLVAVSTFGLLAFFAERRAGTAEKRQAVTAKDNETLTATCVARAAELIEAKGTIRGLNVALAEAAAEAVPVDGSMQRLLQAVAKIHAANGDRVSCLTPEVQALRPNPSIEQAIAICSSRGSSVADCTVADDRAREAFIRQMMANCSVLP